MQKQAANSALPATNVLFPDEGWNRGYCVPIVTPEKMLSAEDTCFCENDGRLRDEVKLYTCPCETPPEDPWGWDWDKLSKEMRSMDPRELSEALKRYGERTEVITDGDFDICGDAGE